MAWWTLRRRSSLTRRVPLITWETVVVDTLARSATSRMVAMGHLRGLAIDCATVCGIVARIERACQQAGDVIHCRPGRGPRAIGQAGPLAWDRFPCGAPDSRGGETSVEVSCHGCVS